MITIRPAAERGYFNHGWLQTYHTFSFGDYHDPHHMGFRVLRVINEDYVQSGTGFPTHGHRDMEIITYVLEGALEHKDSMGNGSMIRPGDVQRMTAGMGVTHSEANPSKKEDVHLLQIWILPERKGLAPSYEQKHFEENEKRHVLKLVASRNGQDGSITVHQDINLYTTLLQPQESVSLDLSPNRHAWVQVARGEILLNKTLLHTSDGAAVSDESRLTLVAKKTSEVLVFEMG